MLIRLCILVLLFNINYYAQSNQFWTYLNTPLQKVLQNLDYPNVVEHQEDGSDWLAYEYGDKMIIYIIVDGFVDKIRLVHTIFDYKTAVSEFEHWYNIIHAEGFFPFEHNEKLFEQYQVGIKIIGKLNEVKNGFIITIEVEKHVRKN